MAILNLGNNQIYRLIIFLIRIKPEFMPRKLLHLQISWIKNAEKFLKLASEIISTQLTKEDPANKALAVPVCNSSSLEDKKNETKRS